ncbi:MAG: TRAP-type C4-dicarboxylate transport system permease small subunit [Arenicella sp.]|jgi:TRAP-type C4-dicarboxylate transport system permease small subunit
MSRQSNQTPSIWQRIDENGERWLLLMFYILIVLVVGVEVFRRFVLSYSSVWGEEVARYAFIYLAWFGTSAAIKDRAHIRIDLIQKFLSRKGQLVMYIFGDLVTLFVSAFAFYFSFETLMTSMKFGSVTHGLGVNQAWFLAAVPLGFSMVLFRLAQSLKRDIGMWSTDEPVYFGKKLFD